MIVDSGPLYAYVDRDDKHHRACTRLLDDYDGWLLVPESCYFEVTKMIGRRLGPGVEAAFLEDMAGPPRVIESVLGSDRRRAAALVRAYADIGLGGTDATLIAIAERLRLTTIATVDRRDFEIVRPRHVHRFRIVP